MHNSGMDSSVSEANSAHPSAEPPSPVPEDGSALGWSQLRLLPGTSIVVAPKLIIDGPLGELCVSITVADFWTMDPIAVEVRPSMRFPQDLHLALLWLEERIVHYSNTVSPF